MRITPAAFTVSQKTPSEVLAKFQTTKGNISEVLKGFEMNEEGEGIEIYRCKAWDYPGMVEVFEEGIGQIRKTHIPAIFHIQEVTQPQGHSTSGSHERYKSKERLDWERQHDCNLVMRQWILSSGFATEAELEAIEQKVKISARDSKKKAWDAYFKPVLAF